MLIWGLRTGYDMLHTEKRYLHTKSTEKIVWEKDTKYFYKIRIEVIPF